MVKRAPESVAALYTSAAIPYASLPFPIRLDVVRNGASYDFKVNGATVYTASYYSSAQHDAMAYYHLTFGSDGTSWQPTVDNFGIDTAAPTISTLNPADDATGVAVDANLVATFNEIVAFGTGNITLKKSADDSVVESFDVASSPRLAVNGATVTIDPTLDLAGFTGYYLQIAAAAIKDPAGNVFAGIAGAAAWNFTTGPADVTPPTLSTRSPADDATGVLMDVNLVATFSEPVALGTGNITLKKSADDSTVETFDVASSSRLIVDGAAVTIDPTANLAAGTGYYVEIAATAVKDLSDNFFAGLAGNAAWNFTTDPDGTAPSVSSLSPADDAAEVPGTANLVLTFSENVQKGAGSILLKRSADDSVVESFDVGTSPRVTLGGATVTVDPTANLTGGAGYYVEMPATAIKDLVGNYFAGLAGSGAWNFTADATAPTLAALSPADDATAVAVGVNLAATFSENVQKGTGNVTLKKSADNSTVEIIPVTSGNVTINNATVTIDPAGFFSGGTGYYMEIASGAIRDFAGNSFAGVAGSTAWNFITAATKRFDDFAADPLLATAWTRTTYNGGTGSQAWNAGDKDLDLTASASGWFTLRRPDATRTANDRITLTMKSSSMVGGTWGVVGLMISSDAAPTLAGTNPRYVFTLQSVGGGNWAYRVARDSNQYLYTSAGVPYASLTLPLEFAIERNGANCDFKVNGATVYTASYYSSAQHDSMVYYHVTWGGDGNLVSTVDDFGVHLPNLTLFNFR